MWRDHVVFRRRTCAPSQQLQRAATSFFGDWRIRGTSFVSGR